MLLVVFGAGASYDSVPSRPPNDYSPARLPDRPPLANQLFDDRPEFVSAMARFPQCQPVVPYLQQLPPDGSVERVLEDLQAEARDYPQRHQHLAAIRFYLHYVLWGCELRWEEHVARGVTNYKTLLDQVQRWRKPQEPICLVTFNYDRLLEAALPSVGVAIRALPDYIASDAYKLIKLHGSVNWAREVDTPVENIANRNVWEVLQELIEKAADLVISRRYRMVDEYPIGKSDQGALFPALAIPVEQKQDYECPPEHLEALRACLPEVKKVLIIGWRATERHFLQLLAENLRHELHVLAVLGGPAEAGAAMERLQREGIQGQFVASESGFTSFVVRREADQFLKS